MDRKEVIAILDGYCRERWAVSAAEEEVRSLEGDDKAEAEARLKAAKAAADEAKARVERLISRCKDKRHAFVLRFRFLHLVREEGRRKRTVWRKRRWLEVAAAVRYSTPMVKRFYHEAISEILRQEDSS